MKKLFITLALACATLPALAQHYHGNGFRHPGHYRGYYGGANWVAPLVIGGVVGYALTCPDPVIVQQPVIIEQQPMPQNQNCGPWKEVQTPDGKIYRERTCTN
jgi:hypothetical protein